MSDILPTQFQPGPKRWRLLPGISVAAGVAVAALGVGTASAATDPSVEPKPTDWHVLVYAVNDSEPDLPLGLDLDEMVRASEGGVDFTVYVDNSADTSFPSRYVESTDEALIVDIDDGVATVTDYLGELDSGSPDTLSWFVATGLLRHPSDRSALVVWDHGSGWKGIAYDEDLRGQTPTRSATSMDAAALGDAVTNGIAAAGQDPFDLLILDACLMANLEVVLEAAPVADYLIASAESIPALGLDYDSFSAFADGAAFDPLAAFDTVAAGYASDVEAFVPSESPTLTLSLIDLAAAPALESAVAAYAGHAAADIGTSPSTYLAASDAVTRYGVVGMSWAGFIDLGEFVGLQRANSVAAFGAGALDPAVTAARTSGDQLLAAIDQAVLAQLNGSAYANTTGITAYLPSTRDLLNPAYDAQPAARTWAPFVGAFFDAQQGVATTADIDFTAAALSVVAQPDGWYSVSAPVTAGFAGTVELRAGRVGDDGRIHYFETTVSDASAVVDQRATIAFRPSLTGVTDGLTTVTPYTQYTATSGYSQFTLQRADGSVALLHWDRAAAGSAGAFSLSAAPTSAFGPTANDVIVGYQPLPGDVAAPHSLVGAPGADPELIATTPTLDPNRPWRVVDLDLPAGTEVTLELRIIDVAGQLVDTRSSELIVPAR